LLSIIENDELVDDKKVVTRMILRKSAFSVLNPIDTEDKFYRDKHWFNAKHTYPQK